ncbi:MAG: hypothetical protein ACRCYD_02585 [Plesiomonas sp.]
MAEIQAPANKVISILVKGKQNDIQWSKKSASPAVVKA